MSQLKPSTIVATILAALLLALGVAPLEGRCAHPDEAARKKWAKLAQPGEHHATLTAMEGDWTYTITTWQEAGKPAQKSTGTARKTMVLGGRFLREEIRGEIQGNVFEGIGYTGFDNATSQLQATWIDNHSTRIMESAGLPDPSGKVHTLHGSQVNPFTGKLQVVRMITRIRDENHHVFEYHVSSAGEKERLAMLLEYTRVPAVAGQ